MPGLLCPKLCLAVTYFNINEINTTNGEYANRLHGERKMVVSNFGNIIQYWLKCKFKTKKTFL